VRVEAGPQGCTEQVKDGRRGLAPYRQPPVDRAPSGDPDRDWPCGYGKQSDNGQAWSRRRQGNANQHASAEPGDQLAEASASH
jgi:hypothetical protein